MESRKRENSNYFVNCMQGKHFAGLVRNFYSYLIISDCCYDLSATCFSISGDIFRAFALSRFRDCGIELNISIELTIRLDSPA